MQRKSLHPSKGANSPKAIYLFAAETTLTEGEIINIAARDIETNSPVDTLSVTELGDVLKRHKNDVLKQREYRASNAQRDAGLKAARAIENVARGTYLTESQLAHLIDNTRTLKLENINESELVGMAIRSLVKFNKKLNEGWVQVKAKSALNEKWVRVNGKALNEKWVRVNGKALNENWVQVDGPTLNEGDDLFKNSLSENSPPATVATVATAAHAVQTPLNDAITRSLLERTKTRANHHLDLSNVNRFTIPNHMI